MKKRIIIMAVAIVLILSGCKPIGMFLQSVFESQDGDLRILYGRNGADYIYDHNVHLSYARGRREDYVGLYLDGESGKEQRILEADFQKAAFENEKYSIEAFESEYPDNSSFEWISW